MSFFGSKKRPVANVPKFETDIDKSDTNRTTPMQGNFKTTPSMGDSEYLSNPGSMKDQIKHLNAYINELAKQNERLQNVVDDCKISNTLNKQMLNDYVNQINEQSEEIEVLKSQNNNLENELKAYQKKMRRRNDAKLDNINHYGTESNDVVGRVSKLIEQTSGYDFENKHLDLLQELNRLKTEIQAIVPSSDDEPERTKNKLNTQEALSCLIDAGEDNEENESKLQQFLDKSVGSNHRILFADKNNQIWEIVKQKDINVDDEPIYA
jgi:chromosome segregation ATPase